MIIQLAIKNLLYKPFTALLSILLLMFGVSIISILMNVQDQFSSKFNADLKDIDVVVGAKGSPLQLVLSSIYHSDVPTGNIQQKDIAFIVANPLVEQAIPIALGDNYKGFSIVGTDSNFIKKYNGTFLGGKHFSKSFDVVIGSNVAKKFSFNLASTFYGFHGKDENAEEHKDHKYQVAGILNPTNTVLDNLIVCDIETFSLMHQEHEGVLNESKHKNSHEAEEHNHKNSKTNAVDSTENDKEITAVLLKFRSPFAALSMPKIINETTTLQAVNPTLEINRLMSLLGIGFSTLNYIAYSIIVMAALSMFIALYSRLNERIYEMALLRCYGFKKLQLMFLLILESVILTTVGFIIGWLLARIGLLFLNTRYMADYHFSVKVFSINLNDVYLFATTFLLAIVVSLFPALKVYSINISKTLSNE